MQPRHTLQLQAERFNKTSHSLRTPNATNNGSVTERLFNQASLVLYPGGTVNQLSYDGFGRLSQIKLNSPSQQTLMQRQYQHDPVSNITRIDENKQNTSNTYLYQYDKLYRLTHADNPSGLPDEQYSYDKLGNRLTDNGKPNPAQTNKQWQYNANNQLTQSATVDTATFGSNSKAIDHSYDANGNLTQNTTILANGSQAGTELANPYQNQHYSYDAQNRLTEVKDSAGNLIASYQYDSYGQRIRKTIHRILNADGSWQLLASPNTYTYYYADEGLVAEYQTAGLDTTTATPSNLTTPKLIAQYGWLPNGVWGTNPVWINTAKQVTTNGITTTSPADYYYYQNDHLGTPQQIIDQLGSIVWQQQSTAFGETTVTQQSIANHLRFAGQYFDSETNTHYNYHRQYNPATGGYTQTDPIGLRGEINTYAYVNGNPLNYIDFEGLWRNPKTGYWQQRPNPKKPPDPFSPTTNPPDNASDALGVGTRGVGCIFAFASKAAGEACMPMICVEWLCTPECQPPYRIYRGKHSVSNPGAKCECVRKEHDIKTKVDNGL